MKDEKSEFDQMVNDLAALKKDVASLLTHARTAATDRADAVYGQIKDRATEPVAAVETYVKEQPFTSLLIAFGVGFLLSGLGRNHHH